ncbi:MAG: (Fe-S)-binding protein [Acidimicrobiales bacterium]
MMRRPPGSVDLGLDPDELNTCVQCGLCLPSCPTFRVTGDEAFSPRGRIALMRAVANDGAPVTDQIQAAFDTCVQCRGCEPACPSSVPYGHLIEQTRTALAGAGRTAPWWQRLALEALAHPRLLRAGTSALAVAQRLRLVPGRLPVPDRLPLRPPPLRPEAAHAPTAGPAAMEAGLDPATPVWLFTGCVMDAWQRPVHTATLTVLEAAGFSVTPSGDRAPCCGALHSHAGLADRARTLAAATMAALDGDQPVAVDSAGCGAALEGYGELLGTPEAVAFADRVLDATELVAAAIHRLPAVDPLPLRVGIQDPCHLRHVQRAHEATRVVLGPHVAELVELDDDGLCCGAGGAYSVLEPTMASAIRDRKTAAIDRAGVDVVASANPGCALHLAAAGVPVAHPMELVARAISGWTG